MDKEDLKESLVLVVVGLVMLLFTVNIAFQLLVFLLKAGVYVFGVLFVLFGIVVFIRSFFKKKKSGTIN